MFYPECRIPMYVGENINASRIKMICDVDVFTHVHGDAALGVEHDVIPLDLDGDMTMIGFIP